MRTDLLRWGGFSSLLLAALFAAALVLSFAMGVDVYDDGEAEELLTDIKDNEVAFLAWALLNTATPLLFVPAALGFVYAARESDRPYLAAAGAFFGLAAVLTTVGYGFGIVQWDVADQYAEATAANREAIIHDAENVQSFLLLISGAAFTPFAIGMITMGVLSLRSRFAPAWIAWPTIVAGVIGLVPFIGFIAVVAWRIVWLAASGIIMLRKSSAATVANERPSHSASPATA